MSWTPTDLGASLALWLDADDTSTILLNGLTVSQWNDKSNSQLVFQQTDGSRQPVYDVDGLTKATLNFDGVDDVLDGDDVLDAVWTGAAFQVFFVAKNNAVATQNGTILSKVSAAPLNLRQFASYLRTNRSQIVTLYTPDTANYTVVNGSTVIADSQWVISSQAYTDTGTGSANTTNRVEIVVNGSEETEVVLASSGSLGTIQDTDAHLSVGAIVGDGTQPGGEINGSIGEILVTSVVTSLDDRQRIEGYLAWKWGGATRLWQPLDLGTDLALWLDAEDTASITLNGSNVAQWSDKSGNNRHATQATAANQPLYVSGGINGVSSVSFVGNDSLLSPPIFSSANDATVICVLKYNSLLSSQSIYSTENLGGVPAMYLQANAGTLRIYGGSYVDDGTYTVGQVEINAFLRGASTGNLWRNGSQVLTDAAIGINTKNVGFLMGRLVSGLYGTFEMGEVVGIDGQASTADRQKLEGYLAHKWGLEANLPVDHPYKDAAPTVTLS